MTEYIQKHVENSEVIVGNHLTSQVSKDQDRPRFQFSVPQVDKNVAGISRPHQNKKVHQLVRLHKRYLMTAVQFGPDLSRSTTKNKLQ